MRLRGILTGVVLCTSLLLTGCLKQRTVFDELEAVPDIKSAKISANCNIEDLDGVSGALAVKLDLVNNQAFDFKVQGEISEEIEESDAEGSEEPAIEVVDYEIDLNLVSSQGKYYINVDGVRKLLDSFGVSLLFADVLSTDAEYLYFTADEVESFDISLIQGKDPVLEEVGREVYLAVKDIFTRESRDCLTTIEGIPAIVISGKNIETFSSDVREFVETKLDGLIDSVKTKLESSDFESTKALSEEFEMYDKDKLLKGIDELKAFILDNNASFKFTFKTTSSSQRGSIEFISDAGSVSVSFTVYNESPAVKIPDNAKSLADCMYNAMPDYESEFGYTE